jgi:DNA-binding transcriptional LysR family regulator
MDVDALADFNAVAQHHGFGPASRALGRPKATLSRRVAQLEESLGVRLVERGARRLRLTEEGLALHERTLGLLAEITRRARPWRRARRCRPASCASARRSCSRM